MTFNWILNDGYEIREISFDSLSEFEKEHSRHIFSATVDFQIWAVLSDNERKKLRELDESLTSGIQIRLGFFHKNEMVGFHFGTQEAQGRYAMQKTGIKPEHQRKGVYSSFLPLFINHLRSLGFQEIVSRHTATNNAVIVPKLKHGFVISGFQISDGLGLLVNLTYFTNASRRKVIGFRSGQEMLDESLLQHIRITAGS